MSLGEFARKYPRFLFSDWWLIETLIATQMFHFPTLNKLFLDIWGVQVFIIVQAGNDIIKVDIVDTKRTTLPTKMKIGIHLEELK